jgi:hypothetical protein
MRPSRAQLLPLFVLLIFMFGCKGAGTALHVLGAVAVTTARVIAVAAAVSAINHRGHAAHAREAAQTAEGQRRAEEAAAYADSAQRSGRCTELLVEVVPPPPPGSPPPPRGFDCDGRVLLQDQEGRWRDYEAEGAPAAVAF